ncbi:MAG: cell division protein FtsL [Spirochaetales bacterium]|nr:cell division protein FtsL [Spirochaetales bacterium]
MKKLLAVLLVVAIPLCLLCTVWQSSRYVSLESELSRMEKEQYEVIRVNNRLISGITILSTPERIEKVATEDLGMRKARADEILRIELKRGNIGG